MSVSENKALVRRFIAEVFEQGRTASVDELTTPDFVSHGLPGPGPDVMKGAIERTSKGLTDATFDIRHVIGEGDLVVTLGAGDVGRLAERVLRMRPPRAPPARRQRWHHRRRFHWATSRPSSMRCPAPAR